MEKKTIYTQNPDGHRREFYVKQIIDKAVTEFVHSYGSTKNNRRVLDLGCGLQPYRPIIEKLGLSYNSLDVAVRGDVEVDYVGSLEDPRLHEDMGAERFDLVICTEVVEHLLNHSTAFNNIASLTKIGGMVLVTTPFIYPIHEAPHDFLRFTPFALERLAQDSGFQLIEQHREGSYSQLISTLMFDAYSISKSSSIRDRLRNRLMNVALKFLNKQLADSAEIHSQAQLYLTNVVVLKKV